MGASQPVAGVEVSVPAGTFKIRLRAALGNPPVEEAAFGFHLRNADTVSDENCALLATHVLNAWNDQMTAVIGFFAAKVKMVDVMCYHLDSSGHADHAGGSNFATSGTGSYQGTATTSLPWECSPVVSLHAYGASDFIAHKARRRGRYYLPPVASAMINNQDGIMNSGDVDSLQAASTAFLEQVNDIPSGLTDQARVVIYSAVDGATYDVQQVITSSSLRSQRRRERQQPVNHTSVGTLAP